MYDIHVGLAPMSRTSKLFCAECRSHPDQPYREEGELLYSSPDAVPILWIFAFGGRNVWSAGDDVQARGGAVGKRLRFETMIEVALSRLEQAEDALRPISHVWPWYAGIPMFRRKLMLKPKTGFLRLHAPWTEQLPEADAFAWRSATAFAENFVNFHATERAHAAAESLRRLRPFCPFLPEGHSEDERVFSSHQDYRGEEPAIRVALLTLGLPDARETFDAAARRDIAPALEALSKLPPVPKPVPPATEPTRNGTNPAPVLPAEGFLGKLTGLFRKRS